MKLLPAFLILSSICCAQQSAQSPAGRRFRDPRYHLSLTIPVGWTITTHDGEVSTFHLDAPGAPRTDHLRATASIAANPYPLSTFSGAFLYFSVMPAATDASCARQVPGQNGTREIAGTAFTRGHTEQASRICTEARDDVYAAYRNHACYRFDLVIHTFCAQVSGAKDMTATELDGVRSQMESILSTAAF